jgi:hypothetical protein
MAKCIIVSGTRVCDGSPVYRVNGRKTTKRFPTLSKAELKRLHPVAKAIQELGVDRSQAKLAIALFQIVMAENWNATKAGNAEDIEQSVRLMLVDAIGKLNGNFTLVAY